MLREFTCIMCPQGCTITAELPEEGKEENEYRISGNRCPRGAEYAAAEIEHPMRSISTSILVLGGELPLASVRLSRPVPKQEIFAVMEEIKKIRVQAPVSEGDIVLADVLGLGSDVLVTKTVAQKKKGN